MKLALISVSDKSNIIPLSKFLLDNDYHIISTGGTYNHLYENIEQKDRLCDVKDFTGFPEILNGRVKTLHPNIYGGILYDPNITSHNKDLDKIKQIDTVIVNLYPFNEVKNKTDNREEIIENIDIGGVSLIRAASKNYKNVSILTDPNQYEYFMNNYINIGNIRMELALRGFEHVTEYDQSITNYFDNKIRFRKYTETRTIKYGCNPYQTESFISTINNNKFPIKILNGNPGYINYLDSFNSWLLVNEASNLLNTIVATSFKHNTPAGVAISGSELTDDEILLYDLCNHNNLSNVARAFVKARNCDALSSFGDFIAISSVVDESCANLIKREVSDGIIALGYTDEALKILKQKKKGKYCILQGEKNIDYSRIEHREIMGLCISQHCNNEMINDSYFEKVPTKNNIIDIEKRNDLLLATITLKYTPSNSIAIANDGRVIGIGAGQQNRVDCIKLAGSKAHIYILKTHPKVLKLMKLFKTGVKRQDKINAIVKYINDVLAVTCHSWLGLFEESPDVLTVKEKDDYLEKYKMVLSSDGFFPFRDNIDYANKYNIGYIMNPGGSICDNIIVDACDEYNIFMALSGKRLFLH